MTRSICEELLEELRRERPHLATLHDCYECDEPESIVPSLALKELAALITKREHAASERMRERMLATIPVCMHFDAQDGGCVRTATHYDEDAGYEPMYCDAHAHLLDEPTEFGWAELVRAAPTERTRTRGAKRMTVGELRAALDGVGDDVEVIVRAEQCIGTPVAASAEYGCTDTLAFMIDVENECDEEPQARAGDKLERLPLRPETRNALVERLNRATCTASTSITVPVDALSEVVRASDPTRQPEPASDDETWERVQAERRGDWPRAQKQPFDPLNPATLSPDEAQRIATAANARKPDGSCWQCNGKCEACNGAGTIDVVTHGTRCNVCNGTGRVPEPPSGDTPEAIARDALCVRSLRLTADPQDTDEMRIIARIRALVVGELRGVEKDFELVREELSDSGRMVLALIAGLIDSRIRDLESGDGE